MASERLSFLAISILLVGYGLFAADRDAYSLQQILSLVIPHFKLLTRAAFLVLFLLAFGGYISRFRYFGRTTRVLLNTSLAVSLIVLGGGLVKGFGLVGSLSLLVYSGVPVLFIWIVISYFLSRTRLFFWFVGIQVTFAVAILYIPEFHIFDGGQYKALEGVAVLYDAAANPSADAGFEKYWSGRYAQFHNPNALGFYAALAIAIGLGWFIGASRIGPGMAIGVFMVGAGTLAWLNSLTRGPLVLLAMGAIYLSLLFVVTARKSTDIRRLILHFFLWVFCLIGLAGQMSNLLEYLVPESTNVSWTGRMAGYSEGLAAVMAHPFLGVPPTWVWESGYPHMLPLAFASDFGVIAGVLISFLLFGFGTWTIIRASRQIIRRSGGAQRASQAVLIMLAIWGGALTNNLIAPVVFWLAFAEAYLATFCVRKACAGGVKWRSPVRPPSNDGRP